MFAQNETGWAQVRAHMVSDEGQPVVVIECALYGRHPKQKKSRLEAVDMAVCMGLLRDGKVGGHESLDQHAAVVKRTASYTLIAQPFWLNQKARLRV